MEVIIEQCCGIDVHKKTIVACLIVGKPGEKTKNNYQNLFYHDQRPVGL